MAKREVIRRGNLSVGLYVRTYYLGKDAPPQWRYAGVEAEHMHATSPALSQIMEPPVTSQQHWFQAITIDGELIGVMRPGL